MWTFPRRVRRALCYEWNDKENEWFVVVLIRVSHTLLTAGWTADGFAYKCSTHRHRFVSIHVRLYIISWRLPLERSFVYFSQTSLYRVCWYSTLHGVYLEVSIAVLPENVQRVFLSRKINYKLISEYISGCTLTSCLMFQTLEFLAMFEFASQCVWIFKLVWDFKKKCRTRPLENLHNKSAKRFKNNVEVW